MRDAFGGAFLIKLFLVFIIIYVGFISVALNYAKAFKVKDAVVNYLEENEVTDLTNAFQANELSDFIDIEIIGNMNYVQTLQCSADEIVYCNNGIRIQKISGSSETIGIYYKVTTTFGWNMPFFNVLLKSGNDRDSMAGRWNISGETRLIVNE